MRDFIQENSNIEGWKSPVVLHFFAICDGNSSLSPTVL